ncbi:hypothetical protein [Hugenholtzia roseola]|uniref:hypothetical protein n=1 Tax=Hugenholtzia roseola TaxID=1002 RepID=UPI00040220FE|nr:hypothetical protein [Hugenholtzia roseola]
MPKFLTGTQLNEKIGDIMKEAEKRLLLVSPYIRLHPHYRKLLQVKLINPHLQLIILFGKNGKDFSRNISPQDIDFFRQFTNIEMRFDARLHAKYYANEKEAILTSMDLYDYSQENHIEAGVLTRSNLVNNIFGESFDLHAYEFFLGLIGKSEIIYKATPEFSHNLLGQKKFEGVQVEIDRF